MDWRATLSALPRWQKWTLGTAIAVAVYGAIGFLVVPPIARSQAEDALRESFGRAARIGEVRVNPFVLSVTVRDFSLPDRDGSPFVELDELHVDFQLSSVFRRAFTFSEIRVVAPFVHVEIQPDGNLNFADLLEPADTAEAEPEASDAGGPPPLLVSVARVERGRILFSDLSHETPFEHEIEPLDVELRDFGTRPDDESPYSFTATTGAGETLAWEGKVSVVPLYSEGRFALTGIRPRTGWLYVQDDVFFEVVDGTVDVEGRYALDARGGLEANLDEGAVRLRDLTVADRDTDAPVVTVPELDVLGIAIAYPEQTVRVESVTVTGGRYHMLRLEDGSLRIEQLARMRASGADAQAPDAADEGPVAAGDGEPPGAARGATDDQAPSAMPAPAPAATPPTAPWRLEIDEIALGGLRFELEDRSTTPPAELTVDPLSVRVRGLSTDPARPIDVSVELGLREEGRLSLEGPVVASPLDVALRVSAARVDLRPFEPYWTPRLAVDLASGRLGIDGRLRVRDAGDAAAPRIDFSGDARVDALRTLDRRLSTDLLSWSALELTALSFTLEPTAFSLDRLTLKEPAVHVVVAPDGTTNLATVTVASPGDAPDSAPAEAPAAPGGQESVPVALGVIELVQGSVDFEDRTIAPRFSTGLAKLSGTIEGLSSDPDARAKVALQGELDGATPVEIAGVLSPLSSEPYLDLRLAFDNFELTPFSPYSGRFLGRSIARGKLFVDLAWVLDHDVLVGENEIFFDQFTLGESVPSEDATDLPVGLAIGLLKDRKGEIHIDLPVRGEIDDPDFSVAGLIGRALRNLILKVATSPFSMMGRLAGSDGDDMKQVDFAPGSGALDAEQSRKIDALAEALAERPALSLELRGSASRAVDGPALQAAALEADLRRRRFRELQSSWFASAPGSVDDVVLAPADRSRLLERAYEERFGEDAGSLVVATPEEAEAALGENAADLDALREEEMARRLREQIAIDRAALRDLARQRASVVRDRLDEAGVAPERLFVLDVEVGDDATDPGPRTTFQLTAL
jgi:hypothetical protein